MPNEDAGALPPNEIRTYFVKVEPESFSEEEFTDIQDQGYVVMDGVAADWPGFRAGAFSLDANQLADGPAERYWQNLFSDTGTSSSSAFEGLPAARISISRTAIGQAEAWNDTINFDETWFEVDLEPAASDEGSVVLYPSLDTSESVTLTLARDIRVSPFSTALERMFSMVAWPEASTQDIDKALAGLPYSPQLLAYNVGQGSASAILDTGGQPRLYIDVGAGVFWNKKTTPHDLKFCSCGRPPVILTHWDADHWSGVRHDPGLLASTWLAPRQNIGVFHARLADNVIHAGGAMLIVSNFYKKTSMHHPQHWSTPPRQPQSLEIASCTGTDRNNSGLAVKVSDHERKLSWLVTGDASYASIPTFAHTYPMAALTVPHHGAAQDAGSVAPLPPSSRYSRAMYSFGEANSYDHPRLSATTLHVNSGFIHDPQPLAGKVGVASGPQVLATTDFRPAGSRFGIAAGWRQAPYLPAHLQACLTPFTVAR